MELSDLHHEEFRIFALEYNTCDTEPSNQFDHNVNTLQKYNEDFDPGINDMLLIPQVRQAHKYPISPREMIHPPGGDNAVCM
jgi:hypothetical protein